ncbi:hypothetical protein FEM48_Zijuj01G0150700 [Ziziphus jujuba var. spinosa]|uniref:Uncharacterized protein n=1 Tax=Ziziphus jujuba var. spinosa TaxID=714518 RepID=A0A978W1Y7_ZIZJJ|nr:hypothetical protein FEM48_Zijuj01G0150700 [Ziziphus jujuba var. spinosa]
MGKSKRGTREGNDRRKGRKGSLSAIAGRHQIRWETSKTAQTEKGELVQRLVIYNPEDSWLFHVKIMSCSCFGASSTKRKGSAGQDHHDIDGHLVPRYQKSSVAWQLHEEGRLLELVDQEMGEYPEEEVIRYMKTAFFCTQAAANRRPMMSQVVDMLSRNIRLNEKQLTAPGLFQDSRREPSLKKSTDDTTSTSHQMSSVPVTITQVTPR